MADGGHVLVEAVSSTGTGRSSRYAVANMPDDQLRHLLRLVFHGEVAGLTLAGNHAALARTGANRAKPIMT